MTEYSFEINNWEQMIIDQVVVKWSGIWLDFDAGQVMFVFIFNEGEWK